MKGASYATCPHCGYDRFQRITARVSQGYRWHVKRCAVSSDADRARWKETREWPPTGKKGRAVRGACLAPEYLDPWREAAHDWTEGVRRAQLQRTFLATLSPARAEELEEMARYR